MQLGKSQLASREVVVLLVATNDGGRRPLLPRFVSGSGIANSAHKPLTSAEWHGIWREERVSTLWNCVPTRRFIWLPRDVCISYAFRCNACTQVLTCCTSFNSLEEPPQNPRIKCPEFLCVPRSACVHRAGDPLPPSGFPDRASQFSHGVGFQRHFPFNGLPFYMDLFGTGTSP